jgi:hypothetical protein
LTAAATMLDVFEPPEGRVGRSAVLVAMTGAKDFLEAAMVRFTGLNARQRAELGATIAYLCLDPHASSARTGTLPPGAVPALHELEPRSVDPTSLLHAKLVLLAFAPTKTAAPTDLRLAVLTANFTYASAHHQLELLSVTDVQVAGSSPARERADVAAAAAFVESLIAQRYYLDERDRPAMQRPRTGRLDLLLEACAAIAPEKTIPGFIHSLTQPLYGQIRAHMRRLLTQAPRNLLLCGSGFYESPSAAGGKPEILAKLEALGVFTDNVMRVAIAEPKTAGAVAPWVRSRQLDGWTVLPSHDVLGTRALHAKFVYAGYLRGGVASNGCLYLGSGNLSRRGLLTSGAQPTERKRTTSAHEGVNIECGIVFAVPDRLDADALAERLFFRKDRDALDVGEWEAGAGQELDDLALIVASPILSAQLSTGGRLTLHWRDDAPDRQVGINVSGADWIAVERAQAEVELSAKVRADALRVRDHGTSQQWTVPIIGPTGHVCWLPPRFETHEEAMAALLDFPMLPAEADDDGDHGDEPGGSDGIPAPPVEDHAKTYALHAAAELLEQVAALQRGLAPARLEDWLDHIDRMFHAAFPAALVATWREHRLDLFAHLAKPALRPPAMTAKQGFRYEAILDAVARAWGLR